MLGGKLKTGEREQISKICQSGGETLVTMEAQIIHSSNVIQQEYYLRKVQTIYNTKDDKRHTLLF
jgi:hypothetical protein